MPRFQFSTLKNNNYTWYFRNINVTCKLAIASLIFSYVFEDWKVSLATQRCHGKLLLFGIFREIKTLKDNRLKVWILYIMGSTLAVCPSLVDFYESLFEYCASVFGLFKHLNQSLKITTQKKMDTNFFPTKLKSTCLRLQPSAFNTKSIYYSMQIFLPFHGRKPATWPADNCLQIMVCSCAMSSNCVWLCAWLQIIFCSCVNETRLFSFFEVCWYTVMVQMAVAKTANILLNRPLTNALYAKTEVLIEINETWPKCYP